LYAFVLAAGKGERLRPLTESIPKPMIEIAGRPILEHNIRMLERYGFRDIIVNTHYRSEIVQEYFGDGSRFGVRLQYSYEAVLLGTAGALNRVRDILKDTFAVIYGDNLTTCNLSKLRDRHTRGTLATLALFEREDVSQSGVARLGDQGQILEFIEKPGLLVKAGHWVSAGLMIMEPAILRYIPEFGSSDFGHDVFPAALAGGSLINSYLMQERLWWVDSLADYEETKRDPDLRLLA
jgi:NDP-sugar pyrophosphorylase family protein